MRVGADESKDKREKKSNQTDRCEDETTRRRLKYEQYVVNLVLITDTERRLGFMLLRDSVQRADDRFLSCPEKIWG